MQIELAKTQEEFEQALEEEQDEKEWDETQRMLRSTNINVREMGRVKAHHQFGRGDCPCSNCGN